MKSITFFTHNVYAMGGTVKSISQLANVLAEKGHKVEIISVFKGASKPYFKLHKSIKVRALTDYQLHFLNIKAILLDLDLLANYIAALSDILLIILSIIYLLVICLFNTSIRSKLTPITTIIVDILRPIVILVAASIIYMRYFAHYVTAITVHLFFFMLLID